MTRTHNLTSESVHSRWRAALEPILTVDPGDTVVMSCRDGFDGQIRGLRSEQLDADPYGVIDFRRVAPVTGPVAVRGAEPGDTLEVRIKELVPFGTAHVVIFPAWMQGDFLPIEHRSRFPEAWIRSFDMDHAVQDGYVDLSPGLRVPLRPMLGMVATAPARGEFTTGPPQDFGGNIDVKDVEAGATVYLPVRQPGALFSAGDGHGVQGDGEICTTGVETPIRAVLEFQLHKGRTIPGPQVETDTEFMTVARGRSLDLAAQQAITAMIDYLVERHRLTMHEAYAFLGLAGDIRVNQVVNFPQLGARLAIPKASFREWQW